MATLSPSQPAILASPLIVDPGATRAALEALGLELVPQGAGAGRPYEHDLLATDDLELDYEDVLGSIQRIISASRGLLVTADVLALRDIEIRVWEALPKLNESIDPSRGRFFYVEPDDLRAVLLTPQQVEALTGRGWRFRLASEPR